MSKSDFPIFANNPGLIYLDSAASAQKSAFVIDGIKDYLERDYANVHRGEYPLSLRSEECFWEGRVAVAEWMEVNPEEVIFTANGTDASNKLALALFHSGMIQSGETIMISALEHHANIIPRKMLADRYQIEIVRIPLLEDGSIDLGRIENNYTPSVRIIALSACSNVTGNSIDIGSIRALIDDTTYLVIDASQTIAHFPVLPSARGADFCWWTGHKIGALPGIGVLRGKKEHLDRMIPSRGGGGAIESVSFDQYSLQQSPDKFEPGTPNLTGIVSIHRALQYLRDWSIRQQEDGTVAGVYRAIARYEAPLIAFVLEESLKLADAGVTLLGSTNRATRMGLFSFQLPATNKGSFGAYCGARNICIRCGGQCAQPYHDYIGLEHGSCRMSLRIYSDLEDCKAFFSALQTYLGV